MLDINSIYLHVPFCRHLCNYCDFFKYQEGSKKAPSWNEYEQSIHKMFDELKSKYDFTLNNLKTLYLGGGTPSLWGKRGMKFLKSFLEQHQVVFDNDYQWTLEIDPGTCGTDDLLSWKNLGVNRFSVGLQTLNQDYLKIADRKHTWDEAIEMLESLSHLGLDFSADFLLGLPVIDNKKRDIKKELETILSYKPKHLSLYILTVPSSYPLYDKLPDDEKISGEYLFVSQYLKDRGFHHYEVSNFSLPGDESRHNFTYWEGESYLGLGPSATGQFRFNENQMTRYRWNAKNKLIEESLGIEELNLEKLYLSLRTCKGFYKEEIPEHVFNDWCSRDLIDFVKTDSKGRDTYRLNSAGFLIVDSLIESLFETCR